MKNKKTKSAATLVINDPAKMSKGGRREVAEWLRRQARFLLKHNGEMAKRFTARFMYWSEEG